MKTIITMSFCKIIIKINFSLMIYPLEKLYRIFFFYFFPQQQSITFYQDQIKNNKQSSNILRGLILYYCFSPIFKLLKSIIILKLPV